MKTKRKALTLALCAVLLVVTSVLGTLAYLTDQESVVNTFTVGQVYIELDEAEYVNGVATGNRTQNPTQDGVKEGNKYHLLPGHTYVKDPTVTVLKDSEECYVRMLVTVNDIDALKAAMPKGKFDGYYMTVGEKDIFLLQMLCYDGIGADKQLTWNGNIWQSYANGYKEETDTETGKTSATYEFRYYTTVAKNTEDNTKLPALFEKITVPGKVDNDGIKNLAGVTITVEAHAIQADGFDTADEAWAAFAE